MMKVDNDMIDIFNKELKKYTIGETLTCIYKLNLKYLHNWYMLLDMICISRYEIT